MKLIQTFTLAACLVFGVSAHASLLSYNGDGQIIGISDVPIGSEYWNATFIAGNFNDSSPPIYPVFVNNVVNNFSVKATGALHALLQNEFLHTAFDDDPTLTLGCDNAQKCSMATIRVTHTHKRVDKYLASAVWNNAAFAISGMSFNQTALEHRALDADRSDVTFVQWDRAAAPSAAPEPTTLALFGIGLAGPGFARKKKKSA